jgi:hypothetical protein
LRDAERDPMDGYRLTAEIVKAITGMIAAFAWPGAIFLIFWLFRRKLIELLPLLILKYKDWQISFGLDKAEEEAKNLPPTPAGEMIEPDEAQNRVKRNLAKLAPRGAIMQARADLEAAVNRFAEAVKLSTGRRPLSTTVNELHRNELIDRSTVNLLNDLRQLGNAAAHNISEPTEEDALRYQELATRLIRQFDIATGAAQMPPPGPITPGP